MALELAAMPGTGKSTVSRRILARAIEYGVDINSPTRRQIQRARVVTPVTRPRYWIGVNMLIARSAYRNVPVRTTRSALHCAAKFRRRAGSFWRLDGSITAAHSIETPVFFEEGSLHQLWRLSHWDEHRYHDVTLRLAESSAVSRTVVALSVDTETALTRVRAKVKKGPINLDLTRSEATSPMWVDGDATYRALLSVVERRPDCRLIKLTTQTPQDTDDAVDRIWELLCDPEFPQRQR